MIIKLKYNTVVSNDFVKNDEKVKSNQESEKNRYFRMLNVLYRFPKYYERQELQQCTTKMKCDRIVANYSKWTNDVRGSYPE